MNYISFIVILIVLAAPLFGELRFEHRSVELKTAPGEEMVTAVYPFSNVGEEAVTIVRTRSSCGCTVPVLDKKTYAPGESGEIKAEFTLGSRKGLQRKKIRVETDETPASRYELKLQVDIPVLMEVVPRVLKWDEENREEPRALEVRLHDKATFDQVKIEGLPENVVATQEETQSGRRISINLGDGDHPGLRKLKLVASSEDGKELSETIYLMIR